MGWDKTKAKRETSRLKTKKTNKNHNNNNVIIYILRVKSSTCVSLCTRTHKNALKLWGVFHLWMTRQKFSWLRNFGECMVSVVRRVTLLSFCLFWRSIGNRLMLTSRKNKQTNKKFYGKTRANVDIMNRRKNSRNVIIKASIRSTNLFCFSRGFRFMAPFSMKSQISVWQWVNFLRPKIWYVIRWHVHHR